MRIQITAVLLFTFIFAALSVVFVTGQTTAEQTGESLFTDKGCAACHTIGKGKLAGPDLLGVTERREIEWLKKWLKNPDTMVMTDPIAKEMLKEYFVPMPNQGLSDDEIEILINYLKKKDNETKD
ncbi:MAG: cytochrome c [Candidatus Dadabacteria bacterium]|nr:cytochrome c [Candidatus Dadabacteria bacterium]NIS07340.1 cytochrome c [Candidatus Dadabacteria bacterium]NIV41284.1 c-type cytochrome [Candidatus Dadabacteria bacterium]NIX14519.1 c-type cytochrome [Candidatus Dadabacteria bacterium]NIY20977.1 c-type cytochrome [Candidatus Dadabacteria bacterium]